MSEQVSAIVKIIQNLEQQSQHLHSTIPLIEESSERLRKEIVQLQQEEFKVR